MPAPTEHKTVQARILAYAQEIGWSFVPRAEAEWRRGFDPGGVTPEERARKGSLFFGDLLHAQVRAFNPKYKEAEGALVGGLQRLHGDSTATAISSAPYATSTSSFALKRIANREAFAEFPNWRRSENELRELRKKMTFAIYAEEQGLEKVSALVESVFTVLQKTGSA